ncbi:MAG: hypothetical protein KAJ25_03525 [Desulfobacula sp.]|nr:hypothetical protein [Desulfobacula sp.]
MPQSFLGKTQSINKDLPMFKPNYSFEKRQKELAKKKKKEEKKQRKLERQKTTVEENKDTAPSEE